MTNVEDHRHGSNGRGRGAGLEKLKKTRPNPTNTAHQKCSTDLDDLIEEETPTTPFDVDDAADVSCGGNHCELSLSKCRLPCFDGNRKFYCPACFYKLALVELEIAQKELVIAKQNTQLARKNVSLFVNVVGKRDNAEEEEVVVNQGHNVDVVKEATDSSGILLNRNREQDGSNKGKKSAFHPQGKATQSVSVTDNDDSLAGRDQDSGLLVKGRLKPDEKRREEAETVEIVREKELYRQIGVDNAEQEEFVNQERNNVDGNFNGKVSLEVNKGSGVLLNKIGNGGKCCSNDEKSVSDPHRRAVKSVVGSNDNLDGGDQNPGSLQQGRPQSLEKRNEETERVGKRSINSDLAKNCTSELSSGSIETILPVVSRKPGVRHKSVKDSTNPAIPQSKRTKCLWSGKEEEMLKKAVDAISAKSRKNLSWERVLAYGQHVFNESRNPVDLKDKWRRMHKGHK